MCGECQWEQQSSLCLSCCCLFWTCQAPIERTHGGGCWQCQDTPSWPCDFPPRWLLGRQTGGSRKEAKKECSTLKEQFIQKWKLSIYLHTPDGLCQKSCMEAFYMIFLAFLYILKQVFICFSCWGECCNTVLLWSSRNILRTTKLNLTDRDNG